MERKVPISRLPPAAAVVQPLALSVSLPDGALFTKNEPTLTRNVPESTVYLKVHSAIVPSTVV